MVKPRKKLSLSDKCPQFFKVFLPERSSQRLQIPPAFVEHFNGVLPSKSIIRSHARRSWRVEVREVDKNVYFGKGWHEFVEDNSLEFGDFLVFCYGGDSIFFVKVYGINGCQKEVCIPTRKNRKSFPIVHENQKNEPMKDEQLILEDNGKQQETNKTLRPRGLKAVQENDKSLKPPGKFLSSYPFFQVVTTKAYVEWSYMHIPRSFVKSYMKKGGRKATLRASAKSWNVKLIGYTKREYRLGDGLLNECSSLTEAGQASLCVYAFVSEGPYNVFIDKG
ncbi:putative B3 domain-containing protein Os03g0621600 [Cornus florida]|uniref:putative B3 domain-containing protein Os03g0621600 n=1 Tax=Cornus florida TaxID=4283 RepID=UPI00289F647E|nr:putative B3 domain-containing protein Os03g0621600 [Cornus florida]